MLKNFKTYQLALTFHRSCVALPVPSYRRGLSQAHHSGSTQVLCDRAGITPRVAGRTRDYRHCSRSPGRRDRPAGGLPLSALSSENVMDTNQENILQDDLEGSLYRLNFRNTIVVYCDPNCVIGLSPHESQSLCLRNLFSNRCSNFGGLGSGAP